MFSVCQKNRYNITVMRIECSKDIDALYIKLREATVADSMDIEEGVVVDLDEHHHIIGIEILALPQYLWVEIENCEHCK